MKQPLPLFFRTACSFYEISTSGPPPGTNYLAEYSVQFFHTVIAEPGMKDDESGAFGTGGTEACGKACGAAIENEGVVQ